MLLILLSVFRYVCATDKQDISAYPTRGKVLADFELFRILAELHYC